MFGDTRKNDDDDDVVDEDDENYYYHQYYNDNTRSGLQLHDFSHHGRGGRKGRPRRQLDDDRSGGDESGLR